MALLMLKCHSSLSETVKPCYRRGVLSSSVCSPKSSLIVAIIAMHSLSTFINISNGHREPKNVRTCGKAFTSDILTCDEIRNDCFLPNKVSDLSIFLA